LASFLQLWVKNNVIAKNPNQLNMKRFSPFRSIIIASAAAFLLPAQFQAQGVGEIVYLQDKPVEAEAIGTAPKTHTVVKGETLNQIAKKYDTSVDNLMAINDLENKNRIYPGQTLNIRMEAKSVTPIAGSNQRIAPSAGQRTITREVPNYYMIKKGDDIFSISDTREVTVDQLKAWNPSARFVEGERVIVGKTYNQVTVGGEDAANKRLSGNLGSMATQPPSQPVNNSLTKPVSKQNVSLQTTQIPRGDENSPEVIDAAGRTYTLPNLRPAGKTEVKQRYGEVADRRLEPMRFYVHHKTLPIGSMVNVVIPGGNGYIQAEVVGRLAISSTADVGLSPDLMRLVQQAPNDGTVSISY
jgi:LysM repeat protein